MNNQEDLLEGITAGLDGLTKEQLEKMKETIGKLADEEKSDELSEDDLDFSMAGFPQDVAQENYESHMPRR